MKSKAGSIVVTSGGELFGRGHEGAGAILVVGCMGIYVCKCINICTCECLSRYRAGAMSLSGSVLVGTVSFGPLLLNKGT